MSDIDALCLLASTPSRRGNGQDPGKNTHGADQDRGAPFPLQLHYPRGVWAKLLNSSAAM